MNFNTNMDNMGGIVAAAFIPWSDLDKFLPVGGECEIFLRNNHSWNNFEHQPKSIKITITPKRNDAGLAYEISGTINLLKSDASIPLLRLIQYIVILYKDVDGIEKVLGTDQYPLEFTLAPLTPFQSSDFFGWQVSFKGIQDIEPPILREVKVL